MFQTHRVILDGFGGQGVVSAGKYLATVAMNCGFACAFTPIYGAEVRGGTSHCDVILAPDRVLSPRIEEPTAAILFCRESYEKYASLLPPGTLLVLNIALIPSGLYRGPALAIEIDATRLATQAGNEKALNMVLVGAWMGWTEALSLEIACETIREISPPRLQKYVESNIAALRAGWEEGQKEKGR